MGDGLVTLGRTVTEQQRNWVDGPFVTQRPDRTPATASSGTRRARFDPATSMTNRAVEASVAEGAMDNPISRRAFPFGRAGTLEREPVDASVTGER